MAYVSPPAPDQLDIFVVVDISHGVQVDARMPHSANTFAVITGIGIMGVFITSPYTHETNDNGSSGPCKSLILGGFNPLHICLQAKASNRCISSTPWLVSRHQHADGTGSGLAPPPVYLVSPSIFNAETFLAKMGWEICSVDQRCQETGCFFNRVNAGGKSHVLPGLSVTSYRTYPKSPAG
jgi:hypothetical protein